MKKYISIHGIGKFLTALLVFSFFMLGRHIVGFEPMALIVLAFIFIGD